MRLFWASLVTTWMGMLPSSDLDGSKLARPCIEPELAVQREAHSAVCHMALTLLILPVDTLRGPL